MIRLAAAVFLVGYTPALGAVHDLRCAGPQIPRIALTAHLLACCGEFQQGHSLRSPELLLELFANPKSGTWTALITGPAGLSCMAAAGIGWRPPTRNRI